MMLTHLDDADECSHEWQPVSMVFETQLLDKDGRVQIRQPDLRAGRVYLVCLQCAQHTYMDTSWAGYRMEGSPDRAVPTVYDRTGPKQQHPDEEGRL